MSDEVNARELYEALVRSEEAEPYRTIVERWLDRVRGSDYRARLATAGQDDGWWATGEGASDGRALGWELYALHRVSDLLLLAHQPPSDGPDPTGPWTGLPEREYLDLFGELGLTPIQSGVPFDPFLHEIVEVDQADDPHAPIELTGVRWPGLMLGDLLFHRAGVRIRAGAEHAERGVADRSPMYWTFRRRHRPTVDLSQGWGHNSQWRTDFRLDYRTPTGDRLNAAADHPIDGNPDLHLDHPRNLSAEERLLTPRERRELLRHRCLLRTPQAADALAGSPGWERDLMPFDWRLPDSET
ncbi:hypothetical protein ACFW1A_38150 [Kitasatospora sp. NPDC058965]|uniref:hypothetical protein n=1 Tax=Kitasatospora sp. NPDC058965 TaxID=3346682 RepID=UPI00369ADA22